MKKRATKIKFEGGLGSQIISYCNLFYMQKRKLDYEVDLNYFTENAKGSTGNNTLTKWPWMLNYYGINQPKNVQKSNLSFLKNSRFFAEPVSYYGKFLLDLDSDELQELKSKFPISPDLIGFLESLNLNQESKFTFIHIRQGDYLENSSRIITIDEVLDGIKRFPKLTGTRVLLASDSTFTPFERLKIEANLNDYQVTFLDSNIDSFLIHGAMRFATMLITSNSTFSWSAGFLTCRVSPIILSPTHFFGVNNHQINQIFQYSSKWMLMWND